MLLALRVKDFAIIDEITLDFHDGLNVITGETGAGKSLLVDALAFLLGERASTDIIRSGSNRSVVEAMFTMNEEVERLLDEWEIPKEKDGTLLVSRELNKSGRSKCRVNGELVTVGMLERLLSNIVEIHGQHEHQKILHRDFQLEVFDRLGGEELLDQKNKVKELFLKLRNLYSERDEIYGKEKERQQRIDLLSFQIEEIEKANLRIGEEEELLEERQKLQNYEKVRVGIEEAIKFLYENPEGMSAFEQLGEGLDIIRSLSSMDENVGNIVSLLENAKVYLGEAVDNLIRYKDSMSFEPSTIEEIEERLYRISQLKRKYGKNIEEILNYKEKAKEELDMLSNMEARLENIEAEISAVEEKLLYESEKLSEMRRNMVEDFVKRVEEELSELGMEHAKFAVEFMEPSSGLNINGVKISEKGREVIEFMLSSNPGELFKPLRHVASGGELSRVMLALKTILNEVDNTPVLVFDEIDAGIGGETAYLLAQKLWNISKKRQIFCVTHLPQIAAWADYHFHVEKKVVNDQTRIRVSMLEDKSRIIELSRMLGGSIVSDVSQQHAKELLVKASELKSRGALNDRGGEN
ncbi:MAG: DNA repair protein RecN [Dictyoglomus sp.]|jgi:DNA repair protein RecN (Recombination protein N)